MSSLESSSTAGPLRRTLSEFLDGSKPVLAQATNTITSMTSGISSRFAALSRGQNGNPGDPDKKEPEDSKENEETEVVGFDTESASLEAETEANRIYRNLVWAQARPLLQKLIVSAAEEHPEVTLDERTQIEFGNAKVRNMSLMVLVGRQFGINVEKAIASGALTRKNPEAERATLNEELCRLFSEAFRHVMSQQQATTEGEEEPPMLDSNNPVFGEAITYTIEKRQKTKEV